MRTSIAILTGLVLLSFGALAASEGGVGNGGVSIVCRDNNGKITSAELLDIYEGKIRYNKVYNYDLDAENKIEQVQLKLSKYPTFLSEFRDELTKIRSIIKDVPVGNILMPTNDAYPTISKKECQFEQVANYTNDGDLLISREIHDEFSNVDRAALLVHEIVYAIFRRTGATDSRQARRLTAELLATNPDHQVIDGILKLNRGTCTIMDCNEEKGNFTLVARTKEGFEVYMDKKTNLFWSDRVTLTMNHFAAQHACSVFLPEVGNMRAKWRLPSKEEYEEADLNGIRSALPNMDYWLWTSSVPNSTQAWVFNGKYGGTTDMFRTVPTYSIRCVGEY